MNFKRHIYKDLLVWKSSPNRKPLILRGARQVGKTTLIVDFAQTYKYVILLNLEKAFDNAYFEKFDDAKLLCESLFLNNNILPKNDNETLLFIDEIQESPKAIKMLRYFYEEVSGLHVIAAGSLLEPSLRKVKSFPVGRINYLYLNPLNFVEFLDATGQDLLSEQLQKTPVKDSAHHLLLNQFHKYAIIGGMPEIIKEYVLKNNIASLPAIYSSIWETYKKDIEKYASGKVSANVIKHIVSTAHLYIDQRVKFQNFGNSNYRSREVGEAFRALDEAKVIQVLYPTTSITNPIFIDLKKSPRLQYLDTGILNYELKIQSKMLSMSDLSNSYKGAIIPHLIMQEIISKNVTSYEKPYFWVREKTQSSSELDLVYPYKDKLIPIEIKSGSHGTLKSLHQFLDQSNTYYAIRIYAGEFNVEYHTTPRGTDYILMNLPYYLGTQLSNYCECFVENYNLK